jgi:hydrogenase maturation protease
MTASTIIIGYGNVDRGDDGVAFVVVNELRRRMGRSVLQEEDTGLDDLTRHNDTIFMQQLVPEVMELFTAYDRMVFVDAHVGPDREDLNCSPVLPEYVASSFTHHMTPPAFLAFLKTLYHCEPEAYLVSIRGYDFDFTRTLSPGTRALVGRAADAIQKLMDR